MFDAIPPELLIRIYEYLGWDCLRCCRVVNKTWKDCVDSPCVWSHVHCARIKPSDPKKSLWIQNHLLTKCLELRCLRVSMLDVRTYSSFFSKLPKQLSEMSFDRCFGADCSFWDSLKGQCPNLVAVTMIRCPFANDGCIRQVCENFQQITSLDISGSNVSDDGLRIIGSSLKALEVLKMRDCKSLTDQGLLHIALGCVNLKVLDLSQVNFANSVSEVSLREIAQKCRKLKSLSIAKNENLNDYSMKSIICELPPTVQELDISHCSFLSDTTLLTVSSRHGAALRVLKIDKCFNITDRGISQAGKEMPLLEYLTATACPWLTNAVLLSMFNDVNVLPRLRYFDLSGIRDVSEDGAQLLMRTRRDLVVTVGKFNKNVNSSSINTSNYCSNGLVYNNNNNNINNGSGNHSIATEIQCNHYCSHHQHQAKKIKL